MAIDEGAPTLTIRSGSIFTVVNMATANRTFVWDQNYGGLSDDDYPVYFLALTGIHNQTDMRTSNTVDSGHAACNLHILNPIGYKDQKLSDVLMDLIIEQAHAGHLRVRMVPTGDASIQWTPSGLGLNYVRIDELMENANTADYVNTTVPGKLDQYTFPALPSNAIWLREAIVSFIGSMTKGDPTADLGMGFSFALWNSILGNYTRTMYADMYANGDITFRQVKFENLSILPGGSGGFNVSRLLMTSVRGSAGTGASAPHWYVYALELDLFCEIGDLALVNAGSFSSLTAACPYTLDFDITEAKDFWEATLDILNHGPEYFLYQNYLGQLSMGKVQKYSTATPIDISDFITGISKGPYYYKERSADPTELRWGVQVDHISSATAQEDPTNRNAERGTRRLRRGTAASARAGYGSARVIDRHFIRSASVAEASLNAQLEMWGIDVEAFDLNCDWRALQVEPGDVVTINRPDLGLGSRTFACVANPADVDNNRVVLTLYDVEFTL